MLEDNETKNSNEKQTDNTNDSGKSVNENEPSINSSNNEESEVKEVEKKEVEKIIIKGRGRHKLDCVCDKCKAKKNPEAVNNTNTVKKSNSVNYSEYSKSELLNDVNANSNSNQVQSNNVNQVNQPPKIDVSKFITGALLLIVMDAIVPSLMLFIVGMFDKKYKSVNKKKLKLDSDEKKALEPIADEVIKHIFSNINPVTAFLVCTAVLYGSKIMDLEDSDFLKNNSNERDSKKFNRKK